MPDIRVSLNKNANTTLNRTILSLDKVFPRLGSAILAVTGSCKIKRASVLIAVLLQNVRESYIKAIECNSFIVYCLSSSHAEMNKFPLLTFFLLVFKELA